MYGLYLAQSVCEKITIFGFAHNGLAATSIITTTVTNLTGSQNARDSAEMIPLEKLVRDKPAKVMFGEPCIGSGSSGSGSNSNRCLLYPKGSRCTPRTWVPIPDAWDTNPCQKKKCACPARSVEGPAKYGTVDTRERCFEQPKVDCFLKLVEIERLKCC